MIFFSTLIGLIACAGGRANDHFIKIYDMDKPDKTGLPSLVRTTRLNQSSGSFTSLVIEENLNLIAAGFNNGYLILIRGDLRRERGIKQKTLCSSANSSTTISGLAFRASKLYVATSNEVLVFNVAVPDKETSTRLDDIGCDIGMIDNFIRLATLMKY